ncbi:MAG: hypothetical protein HY303_11330, partial [Candidatus Wallbacteria bacterium]|nr:hypothetical protein [Candidatus Wallbacteria bacterium]
MKLETLLAVVGADPIFESSLLLAGDVDPADVSKQLSRWTRSGTIWQMRRGLYCLAPPYRKIEPHPFLVANSLVPASYVSLQSALAFWQLIPEYAAAVTSVTTHGPRTFDTRLGRFELRHVKKGLFSGYRSIEVSPGQRAFVASPEKALLDLIHLTPGGDGEV